MSTSLQPAHLGRYARLGALLLKHRGGVSGEGVDETAPPVGADDQGAGAADAAALVEELEAMGPTFVKLGQLLSTRADLLPEAYLDALARLQDDVAPFGFGEVEQIVESELGARLSKAFASFDHQPMASASLGQVHRAVLRDGRPVAVKVQRPGIRSQVVDDMEVIEELAGFVDQHTRTGDQLRFAAMAAEFRRSLMAELDYRREADNLRTLAHLMEGHERIVVPCPVDDFTTSTVLTMDLVEGRSVGSIGPLGRTELDGGPLAADLLRGYLDQILVHGFVHADPHPGNVLITDDGRVALIDLGMVVHVAPDLQEHLIRLLASLSEGRSSEVADLLVAMGEKGPDFDDAAYRREVEHLVLERRHTTVEQLEAGALVGQLARAAASCGLRPPVEMTMIGKALLNLDHVARTLDPHLEPNAVIREHTAEVLQARLRAAASPASLVHAALDAKDFAARLPGRINKLLDELAEGELTLNVQGIDEADLMRGIQKIANRVTTGIVIAALIIGAAMVMRIETSSQLFGYPPLAIVLFVLASVAGVGLVVTSLLNDLPPRRRRR